MKRIGFTVLVSLMVSINAMGQDLIARKAPSDNKLIDLKSIRMNTAILGTTTTKKVEMSDIYSTWDNKAVSIVKGELPANFKVDLRGFAMPTPSRKITSNFGRRWGRNHNGLDISVHIGDTIYAAFDGKVRIVRFEAAGWGKYVLIRHPNGLETLYAHMSKQLVSEEQVVKAGDPIGLGGITGRSTGPHLHFETRLLGVPINPALMFDFPHQDVTGDYYISSLGEIKK